MTRDEFASTVRADVPKWGQVITKLGIKVE
jgi:hypothetical protein